MYSQLKFKLGVELEQTNKDIARTEQKVVFSKELLKRIENEIQAPPEAVQPGEEIS